jgi:exonuclease III
MSVNDLNIVSLNCRGLNGKCKRLKVFNYLKKFKAQIYCLQDTHFTPDMYNTIYSEWGHECFLSYGTSNSRGTGIFFSKNTDYKIHNYIEDTNGDFLALDISLGDNRFTLFTLYGPNNDTPSFYDNVFKIIELIGNESFIICGDFNLVLDPELDYFNYKNINNSKARNKVLELMINYSLIDPFRHQNSTAKRFTWRRTNPLQQARLDFFLITSDMLQYVKSTTIEPSLQSDHSVILLNLSFNSFQHKPGLWKHNNSLLSDIAYVHEINNKIDEIKLQYAIPIYNLNKINEIPDSEINFVVSDQLFLETLLMELRGKSISFGSLKEGIQNSMKFHYRRKSNI